VLEQGEWWRVVSAMFLHASWMHLAMNVLGLVWFGPFVERFLGRARFALVYLVGGAGGFALLAALDAFGVRGDTAALGASGSVMALIGASTGIFLRGSARSPIAARRLREMLSFVGIQFVFDILAPRVSMTAHLAGLAIGFLIGVAIARRPT
jgi:rhomboid protease GluP